MYNTDSHDHTHVPCIHKVSYYVLNVQHHDACEVARVQPAFDIKGFEIGHRSIDDFGSLMKSG